MTLSSFVKSAQGNENYQPMRLAKINNSRKSVNTISTSRSRKRIGIEGNAIEDRVETYRCYFLSGTQIIAAAFLVVENLAEATILGSQLYRDRLFSLDIDGMEIWQNLKKLTLVPLDHREFV